MSRWREASIEEACNVEYGTRVVHKRDGGSLYPVYGGGGATFRMDEFNRQDRLVVARFAISEQCTRFVRGKFFLNDSGLTISPKDPSSSLNPRFLDYHTLAINDEIYALSRGSAQRNLDTKAFRQLRLRFPTDIAEQKRIVAILDEAFAAIDTAIENAQKKLVLLGDMRQSILAKAFEGELTADLRLL